MARKKDVEIHVVLPEFTKEQLCSFVEFLAKLVARKFIDDKMDESRTNQISERDVTQEGFGKGGIARSY